MTSGGKYASIINRPHYQSPKRPHMSNYDRAAQFSPFAALTGYEAAMAEAGRLTDAKIELSDEEMQAIDRRLQFILAHIEAEPEVEITYFQPDAKKQGGRYGLAAGRVRRIDTVKGRVILADRQEIPIRDILRLEGELLRGVDWDFES